MIRPRSSIKPLIVLAFALGVAIAEPPKTAPTMGDEVVAVVERTVITGHDLDLYVFEYCLYQPEYFTVPKAELRPMMVTRAVDDFLLSEWARLQLDEPPAEAIDSRAQSALTRFEEIAGGTGRIKELLRASNIDVDEFRAWVREQARRSFLIHEAIEAFTDTKGTSLVDSTPKDALSLRLGQILIAPRKGDSPAAARAEMEVRAAMVRRDIEAGIPFGKAAALYSDDELTASRGGLLGWFEIDQLDPRILAAARATPARGTSQPVEMEDGVRLIHVFDFETADQRRYEAAIQTEERTRVLTLRRETDIVLAPGFVLDPPPPVATRR